MIPGGWCQAIAGSNSRGRQERATAVVGTDRAYRAHPSRRPPGDAPPSRHIDHSGSWDAMMANVTSVLIRTELGTGYDVTGLDNVVVSLAQPPNANDIDGDGIVGTTDLLALLAAWGDCPLSPEDVNGDGVVNTLDLLQVLGGWASDTS